MGDLFDLKGRQTGDVSQFVAAQAAYNQALELAPNSSIAYAGQARIQATLHDFAGAVASATVVLQLDPSANDALGVIFDASIELGDLANARLALERLAERVDSPSVTIRRARLAFVEGNVGGAMDLARAAATETADVGGSPTSIAFYQYSGAEYALLSGNLDAAEAGYQDALESLPNYPLAIYGEGRVAYARGDLAKATARLEAATAALPRPDMLAFLGDLYTLAGEDTWAADQYATVDFIASMTATDAGAVYDREYALFLADHNRDVAHALQLAEAEAAIRHDVYAYDTLAWALHANGREPEALAAVRSGQALDTVDAKLLIHAGLIELANGLAADGRAHVQQGLDLHPAISPLVVQQALEALAQ
jgi:tetratricopeptide (TPR) repeat protein